MLQFWQYKIFGRHTVPDGWIVVTAGNPPEYNNSVREFDIVTWDRLKRVDVDPDYEVWKEYAYKKGVHASIISYLEIKKSDFYSIETTVDGKSFVTARGWSDLSDMLYLYEKNNIKVDLSLVGQYLQNKKIAKSFAVYYDLFNKYKSDYQVDDILAGTASESIKHRAKTAKFDERLAVLGLIIDKISAEIRDVTSAELVLRDLLATLKSLKAKHKADSSVSASLLEYAEQKKAKLAIGIKASSLSVDAQNTARGVISVLENMRDSLIRSGAEGSSGAFGMLKDDYNNRVQAFQQSVGRTSDRLTNIFKFCDEVFPEGQELLILVTELTINCHSAEFISHYGCPEYFKHNKELLFYERQKEIIRTIENWDIS
jgi:hypothetical protein